MSIYVRMRRSFAENFEKFTSCLPLPKKYQFEAANHIPAPKAHRCDLTNHLNSTIKAENAERAWSDGLTISAITWSSIIGTLPSIPCLIIGAIGYSQADYKLGKAKTKAHEKLSVTLQTDISEDEFQVYYQSFRDASTATRNVKNLEEREDWKQSLDDINRRLEKHEISITQATGELNLINEQLQMETLPTPPINLVEEAVEAS